MIKTLISLFTIYSFTHGQTPPYVPAVQAVPSIPQIPAEVTPATTHVEIPVVTPATTIIVEIPVVTPATPIVEIPVVTPATTIVEIPAATTIVEIPVVTPTTPIVEIPVVTPATTYVEIPAVTQPAVIAPPLVTPIVEVPPISTANPNQYIPVTSAPANTAAVASQPPSFLPAGQFKGAFNQICDYSLSPIKDVVCKAPGQIAVEQYTGFMKCERGYDCCMCGKVTCGNQQQGCNTFSAGDSGVFGVKEIYIYGREQSLGGGAMNFIGYEAGANSIVNGRNIKSIMASGQLALLNAQLVVNPISDFSFECSGVAACDNMDLTIRIPGPPPGYQCNPSYAYEPIELYSLHCGGKQSCRNAHIRVVNEGCVDIELQQLECTLPDSCIGTTFEFVETNAKITINSCDVGNGAIPVGVAGICGIAQGQGQPWQQPYQNTQATQWQPW